MNPREADSIPRQPFLERQAELESWIDAAGGSGRLLARYRELLGSTAPSLDDKQMIAEILSREYPEVDEQ
jgi:hypothetical protein